MIYGFSTTETGRHEVSICNASPCLCVSVVKLVLLGGVLLAASCSKREPSAADEAEWADIQPIAETTTVAVATNRNRRVVQSEGEDYSGPIQRLEQMKSVDRAAGETMITGESLVLDYERRFVRMDHEVKVVDDRGVLETEVLVGRFSESNEVELIEARKGVRIASGARMASADGAVYAFQTGSIQLDGNAQLAEDGNRLSAGKIQFWIKGSRKMVCEPDALLEIAGGSGLVDAGELAQTGETTRIHADRLVFDEDRLTATFEGHVRLRDLRAKLDCDTATLYLKEGNEIDWIEARSGVIIQSDGRKALADRATYHVDDGRFVLEGEPKVMEERNIMTGDRIVFWPKTRRMVCEPNARVLLYPDEEMKAKFMKDLED